MNSLHHHYGVEAVYQSTPIWSVELLHQIGADGVMNSVNNIEALREARGWKRPELARRMDTTPQQVERLEKGQRKLSQDWIDRAAKAFGVAPADIISPGVDVSAAVMQPGPRDRSAQSDHLPTRSAHQDDGAVEVRQVDLAYAMGPGTHVDDFPDEIPVKFDPHFLRALTRAAPERLFVARGDGDSMSPTLINDDMVMIDTTQKMLNMQDRIWAVSVYGAGMIKRLRATGEGKVMVLSDNPTVPEQEVSAEDLHIVGRVIWVGRRI
jgi:phage repressor protein C with HTH and peptisase S24 domain